MKVDHCPTNAKKGIRGERIERQPHIVTNSATDEIVRNRFDATEGTGRRFQPGRDTDTDPRRVDFELFDLEPSGRVAEPAYARCDTLGVEIRALYAAGYVP